MNVQVILISQSASHLVDPLWIETDKWNVSKCSCQAGGVALLLATISLYRMLVMCRKQTLINVIVICHLAHSEVHIPQCQVLDAMVN